MGKKATEVLKDGKIPKDWMEISSHVALNCEPTTSDLYSQETKKWFHVSLYCPQRGHFVSISEDITQRKQLRAQIEAIARFPSENPNPIFRIDSKGTLLYGNMAGDSLLAVWNCKVGERAPEHISQVVVDALASDKRIEFEETYGNKALLFLFVPITTEGYVNIYANDITERKKAEETLRQSEHKLEEYSKDLEKLVEERAKQLKDSERLAAIGATAGMVGHDIRNPLQAITSDLYLAKTELDALPENEQKKNAMESLDEIQNNIDYINKIVADLQDYARPLNPRAQETNIKTVFNDLLAKNGIPKNINISIKVEDKTEKIMVDPDYLKRIAANLTLNAVQAMPDGGKLTIHAYTDKATNDVLITIKDTGVGIPEDIKPKLFTPMMTTKSKGQGFGLAVVKRMTEGLGGTVTFESTQGKGTTFTVRLPPTKELNGKLVYK